MSRGGALELWLLLATEDPLCVFVCSVWVQKDGYVKLGPFIIGNNRELADTARSSYGDNDIQQ